MCARRGPWRATILLAFLLAAGCKRGAAPGAPEGEVPPGPYTTDKTPDGEPLVATFPGKPEWTDIPDTFIPARGFVWRGDGSSRPLAVWVWTSEPAERDYQTDSALATWYGRAAAGLQPTDGVKAWLDPAGVWRGGWDNKPRDPGHWRDPNVSLKNLPRNRPIGGTIPVSKGVGAGVAVVVGNKVYGVRATGADASHEDPDFKALLDSLRVPGLANRPPRPPAPEGDLRPIAKLPLTHRLLSDPDSGGGAVCPTSGAAFFALTQSGSEERLLRYRYPSFAPDGEYKLPRGVYAMVPDDRRNRLYFTAGQYVQRSVPPGKDTELVRFDVGAAPGAGKTERVEGWASAKFTGRLSQLAVAPDGRFVYALHTGQKDEVELVRVDAQEMAAAGWLQLAPGTRSLCLSPDGKTLYAGVDGGGVPGTPDRKCRVQEIDGATLKERRSFVVRGRPEVLVCGAGGALFLPGTGCLTCVTPTAPGPPAPRPIADIERGRSLLPTPDGKRLYVTGEHAFPYSIDAEEAARHGRLVIAPKGMAENLGAMSGRLSTTEYDVFHEPFSAPGSISPDGKCLLLNSGHVFWLAGSGPEPVVDPATAWDPRRSGKPAGAAPVRALTPWARLKTGNAVLPGSANRLLLSDDGGRLAVAVEKLQRTQIWDLTGAEPKKLREVPGAARGFAPDGSSYIRYVDGGAELASAETGETVGKLPPAVAHFYGARGLTRVVTADKGGKGMYVSEVAMPGARYVTGFPVAGSHEPGWALSLHGQVVVQIDSRTGRVKLSEGRTPVEFSLAGTADSWGEVSVSRFGGWYAGRRGNKVEILKGRTGAVVNSFPEGVVSGLFVTNRELFLAQGVASAGNKPLAAGLHAFHPEQKDALATLPGATSRAGASANGKVLATEDAAGDILLWDLTQIPDAKQGP